MNYYEILKKNRDELTKQQYLLLKGQIKSGDGEGAMKGIRTILRRKNGEG